MKPAHVLCPQCLTRSEVGPTGKNFAAMPVYSCPACSASFTGPASITVQIVAALAVVGCVAYLVAEVGFRSKFLLKPRQLRAAAIVSLIGSGAIGALAGSMSARRRNADAEKRAASRVVPLEPGMKTPTS